MDLFENDKLYDSYQGGFDILGDDAHDTRNPSAQLDTANASGLSIQQIKLHSAVSDSIHCNPVRSTRSSHKVNLLVVPHQKSNKYSEKSFAVVGPRLWNELLTDELRGCNSVDTFKKKLKTMLFKKHY